MVWSGKSEDCDEFTRNNSEVLGSSIHCHCMRIRVRHNSRTYQRNGKQLHELINIFLILLESSDMREPRR